MITKLFFVLAFIILSNFQTDQPFPVFRAEKFCDKDFSSHLEPVSDLKTFSNNLTIKNSKNEIELSFVFDNAVPAAIFKSGQLLWLVFEQKILIDVERIKKSLPKIHSCQQMDHSNYTILYLEFKDKFPLIKTKKDRFSWVVNINKTKNLDYFTPDKIIQEVAKNIKDQKTYLVERSSKKLSLLDPVKNDILEIVPVIGQSYGTGKNYLNPEYEILPSAQGFAVSLNSDNVSLKMRKNLVTIITNLFSRDSTPDLETIEESIEKYQLFPSVIDFGENSKKLPRDKEVSQKLEHFNADDGEVLFQQMKKYTKNNLYQEALSVSHIIDKSYNEISQSPLFIQYKVFLNLIIGRFNTAFEAANKLNKNDLSDNQKFEESLWEELIKFKLSLPSNEVINYQDYYDKLIRYYPLSVQFYITEIILDYFSEQKNYLVIQKIIDIYLKKPISPLMFKRLQFYRAVKEEGEKNVEKALSIYQGLSEDFDDNFNRARSILNLTRIKAQNNLADYKDLTEQLKLARFLWRGDNLELSILSYLAELNYENKDYDDAIRTWKTIINDFPNNADYLTILSKMTNVFVDIYSQDDMECKLSPFQKIAFYHEFKELTPVGTRGDNLVTKLVDLAISLNLIEEAIKIIDYQIKYRFTGEKLSKSINQIASLYLVEDKPDEALEYIKQHEIKDLDYINYLDSKERNHLRVESLIKKQEFDSALSLIEDDHSVSADSLRCEIYWQTSNWPKLEKYLLYKLANPNGSETQEKISSDIFRLAISYNKQGKNILILDIIQRFPSIFAYNASLYNRLILLLNEDNSTSPSEQNNPDISNIQNIINEIKKKK